VLELAHGANIPVEERRVSLTEFYTADEVFTVNGHGPGHRATAGHLPHPKLGTGGAAGLRRWFLLPTPFERGVDSHG
jgi:hypothetical protein